MTKIGLTVSLAALALAGCATYSEMQDEELGSAILYFADGSPAGTAQVMADGTTAKIAVNVSGMDAGQHGFHLHQTGTCTAPDFKSAGGHLNPYGKSHGSLSGDGSHLGDLPNLTVGQDGRGAATAEIGDDIAEMTSQIFDADGTAVVVHAGPDDYVSDPAGDAGSRVACGVIERS